MSLRPLGIAREIVEDLDLEVAYAYDDLVFVEHNAFLLQFDEQDPKSLKLFFNHECDEVHAADLEKRLIAAAAEREFTLSHCGAYELVSEEGAEQFELRFLPAAVGG